MAPRIAIVFYSMFDHNRRLALAERRGVETAGGTADIFQIEETLPPYVLDKFGAAPTDDSIPIASPATLEQYDGFIFGIPTHFGNMPLQWAAFWDEATEQWRRYAFHGKLVAAFVSCSGLGGGQESTIMNMLPTFVDHGMTYISLGCVNEHILTTCDRVSGGSPWGAGSFAGATNTRMPADWELEIAERQGRHFYRAFA